MASWRPAACGGRSGGAVGCFAHDGHRAMHELQRLGLVVRRQRRGTVVAPKSTRRTGYISLLLHNSHDRLEMDYLRGIHAGIASDAKLVVCDTEGEADKEAHYCAVWLWKPTASCFSQRVTHETTRSSCDCWSRVCMSYVLTGI